jgi:Flp pilus assembly protein TadD
VALLKQGRTEEAAAALRALLENERLCAMIRNDLGSICSQQGNKEEAAMHFERALFLDPNDLTAHKNLADLYLQLGRQDDAVAVLRRAATLDPGDGEIATLLDLASGPLRAPAS